MPLPATLRALQYRNFRLFFGGQLISLIGTWMQNVAQAWLVYQLTGSPFYLGLYTGYDPWDSHGNYTGIYTDPVFAWGEFVNNGGAIEMLSSALEYGGGGIYANTENIIPAPEPSIFGLSTLGALLLGWRALGRRQ